MTTGTSEKLNLPKHLIPVDARQAHIKQNDDGTFPLDNVQGGLALAGPEDIDVAPLSMNPRRTDSTTSGSSSTTRTASRL